MSESEKKKVSKSAGLNPSQVLKEAEDIHEKIMDVFMVQKELDSRLYAMLQHLNYNIRCLRAMPKE